MNQLAIFIRVRPDAASHYQSGKGGLLNEYQHQFWVALKHIEGQRIPIETDNLFVNSVNTAPMPHIGSPGLRLGFEYIDGVEFIGCTYPDLEAEIKRQYSNKWPGSYVGMSAWDCIIGRGARVSLLENNKCHFFK